MNNNGFLYNWVNFILMVIRGKRIFVFAESKDDLKEVYKEIDKSSLSSIDVFTNTKDMLNYINKHPNFKYSEGYLIEKNEKKSTVKLLAAFIHQSAPTIKIKTLISH